MLLVVISIYTNESLSWMIGLRKSMKKGIYEIIISILWRFYLHETINFFDYGLIKTTARVSKRLKLAMPNISFLLADIRKFKQL
jgi:hypothetical protein